MKQIDIQKHICTASRWHEYPKSHFQIGETKCRKCDIYYKTTYKSNLCAICHSMLAHKSKTRNVR